jgi:hypothetical protein
VTQQLNIDELPQRTAERLRRLLGSDAVSWRMVERGYTPARRWVMTLGDGRRVFVKQAIAQSVVPRLRVEARMYQQLDGAWLPQLLGFDDDTAPILVLEDLSDCHWPPPWKDGQVEAVHAALQQIAAHPAPESLRRLRATWTAEDGWPEVARDPGPFLSLQLCTRDWLEQALPLLLEAADPKLLDGGALCHLDVRSDNLCLRSDGQAILVDWDCAALGNPAFDLAFWLPSLKLEGGPDPWRVANIEPGIVALVAGFFAANAGLPDIPMAPRVRTIQRAQLKVALPWAAQALGLGPPYRRP